MIIKKLVIIAIVFILIIISPSVFFQTITSSKVTCKYYYENELTNLSEFIGESDEGKAEFRRNYLDRTKMTESEKQQCLTHPEKYSKLYIRAYLSNESNCGVVIKPFFKDTETLWFCDGMDTTIKPHDAISCWPHTSNVGTYNAIIDNEKIDNFQIDTVKTLIKFWIGGHGFVNIIGASIKNYDYISVSQVTGLKMTKQTMNEITIEWDNAKNADKYVVYRSTDGKKWTKVAITEKLTFSDNQLIAGMKYQYKIKGSCSIFEYRIYGKASLILKTGTLNVK